MAAIFFGAIPTYGVLPYAMIIDTRNGYESLLSMVQVVPSLDDLPTLSYSASKLTIHFTCTSVAKPKNVSQTTDNPA